MGEPSTIWDKSAPTLADVVRLERGSWTKHEAEVLTVTGELGDLLLDGFWLLSHARQRHVVYGKLAGRVPFRSEGESDG